MKENHNKTIETVVKDELCTGCGTCAGLCPTNAIEMVISRKKGIYVPIIHEGKCTKCGLCFEVCPGHSVDFNQLNLEFLGRKTEDVLLGSYLNCYTGHASDPEVRYNSASGGLVTALLIAALESGLIDGALVTRMNNDNPLEPQPFIARTREEIIKASKSKYCPVPLNIALKEISTAKDNEKFAIVGLSCHIHGARKAEQIDRGLKEKIVLHLGLFCNHAPSGMATKYLLKQVKIKPSEISALHYRGEGWPGKMKIELKKGRDIFLQFPEYWNRGFGHLFYQGRCMLCCDQGNELADASFGDPWGIITNDKAGSTIAISRSEVGDIILQKSKAKHTALEALDETNIRGIGFRRSAMAASSFRRLIGQAVPYYNREILKPTISEYIKTVRQYLLKYVGSNRLLWPVISKILSLRSSMRG